MRIEQELRNARLEEERIRAHIRLYDAQRRNTNVDTLVKVGVVAGGVYYVFKEGKTLYCTFTHGKEGICAK